LIYGTGIDASNDNVSTDCPNPARVKWKRFTACPQFSIFNMNEVPSTPQDSLTTELDEDTVLLVEMSSGPGMRQVSLSPADLAKKSTQAVDKAMGTIRAIITTCEVYL